MTRLCSYGKEIAGALKDGRWPQGCDSELRSHVDACRSCSDLVLVTQTFQDARNEAVQMEHVDSPGLLWWRAQLRRRNAAVERVSKPITVAQRFAALVFLLVAAGFVASQFGHSSWVPGLPGLSRSHAFHLETLWSLASVKVDWSLVLLIPTLGALAVLSGVVLYLASDRH
ncbi:MAG TPA: hypothetical protein VFE61_00325 [Candidatus Sulfotelmatobacter sp.]|jgi:hypothetical protein|nr:hypothetical protein [Candidatus Sulfotelmatobacter sp.]